MVELIAYLQGAYPSLKNYSVEDMDELISVWADVFEDIGVNFVLGAVKAHIKEHGGTFAPSASEIYGVAKSLQKEFEEQNAKNQLSLPEKTNGKCPYSFCDGEGFFDYERNGYGHVSMCPCYYDERLRQEPTDNAPLIAKARDRSFAVMNNLKKEFRI